MTKEDFYQSVLDAYRPAESLIRMVPGDKLDWKPGPTFMSLGQLICHLSEGIGGAVNMLLTGGWPALEEMEKSMRLENIPSCSIEEALSGLEKDKAVLQGILSGISEEDFLQRPVSVPWGVQAKLERMTLDFREHFTNHKMQLFTYLKLLGLPVNTSTLYFG
jgi:hypothetical protein